MRTAIRCLAPLVLAAAARAQTTIHTLYSSVAGDQFGRAVCGGSDFDHDGFMDFVIGAPFADPEGLLTAGVVQVRSGRLGTTLLEIQGTLANLRIGGSVGIAGDIDGDGFDDVIAGAWEANKVFVHSGRDGSLLRAYAGPVSSWFGFSVCGAGDLDGDGLAEIAIGAVYGSSATGSLGSVTLYKGADGTLLREHLGPSYQSSFGFSVRNAGDVDADGIADLIVGARSQGVGGWQNIGAAYVYSGRNGALLHTFLGPPSGPNPVLFGSSVDGAGDVDGDGHADLIVAADYGSFVRVYSGSDGSLIRELVGPPSDPLYAASVCGVGDPTGDGFDDYVVSWRGIPPGGSVRLYSGFDGSHYHTFHGDSGFHLGGPVHRAGDVDGDGVPDVVMGSTDTPEFQGGGVKVFSFVCDPPPSVYCPAAPNSTGAAATLAWNGPASLADNAGHLVVAGAPPGVHGFFLYGTTTAQVPFGDGFLCIGGLFGIVRIAPLATVDATGAVDRQLDLEAPPFTTPPYLIGPGAVRCFQFWFRDPFGPGGSGQNLSSAVSVTYCP